jgi:hypothetical protein
MLLPRQVAKLQTHTNHKSSQMAEGMIQSIIKHYFVMSFGFLINSHLLLEP